MVVILKEHAEEKKVDQLLGWLELMGVKASIIKGSHTTILGLVGDTSKIDIDSIRAVDIVENVTRVQEPYKNANRKFHPDNTVIDINGRKLGGDEFHVISGPCSVESEAQILEVARRVKAAGATMLRGGA